MEEMSSQYLFKFYTCLRTFEFFYNVKYFLLQTHIGRARSRSVSRRALKRKREPSMEVDTNRSRSRSRTVPRDQSGLRDPVVS